MQTKDFLKEQEKYISILHFKVMQKLYNILAVSTTKILKRKVDTFDIKIFMANAILIFVCILVAIFLAWLCFGLNDKTAEIATAFVEHFSTIK